MSAKPYPGLRPFERGETDIFFGREEHTDALVDQLAGTRFLSVIGPSGCGKSSLVKAGLLDALESGFMAGASADWRFAEMRPGDKPLLGLADALLDVLEQPRYENDSSFLRVSLERGPRSLIEFLDRHPLAEYCNLLILVDQFEEIFRFASNANQEEADSFIALLLETVRQRMHNIYVVITMRSDYIGDCARFPQLPEAVNQAQFLTPRLTREQSREAIEGPARVFGGRIEPALVNRLLNDMGTDPDQLPLMQHALMRMWDRVAKSGPPAPVGQRALAKDESPDDGSSPVTLTVKDYVHIGELGRALSKHADAAFNELGGREKQIAETLFRILTERRPERHDLRRPTSFKTIVDIVAKGKPDEGTRSAVKRVVNTFRHAGRRFITLSKDKLEDTVVLDISHESLIRKWHRLNEWAVKEADSANIYREMLPPSGRWEKKESGMWKALGELWRGHNLTRARKWRQEASAQWAQLYGGNFAAVDRFISASRLAATLRGLAYVALFLVFCTLLITIQGHFASLKQERALREEETRSREEAEVFRDRALKTESRLLATQSLHESLNDSSTTGMILALNALPRWNEDGKETRPHVPIAERALYTALHLPHELAILEGHQKAIVCGTFSPDGQMAATASWDGTSRLWNGDSGELVHELSGHEDAVVHVTFDPSGQSVATSSNDRTARIWDAATGQAVHVLSGHREAVLCSAFSPDGSRLATASADRTARIWDTGTGRLVHEFSGHDEAVLHIAFSLDGTRVLTASWDGTARIWDVVTGEHLHTLNGHTMAVKLAVFGPADDLVITVSDDATARIWNARSGDLLRILQGHAKGILYASFNREGDRVVTASRDGTARIWDTATGDTIKILKWHTDEVRSAVFSPQGDRVLTASKDDTASLWDSDSGERIYPLRRHAKQLRMAVFNPKGDRVLSVSHDNTARIWHSRRNRLRGHTDVVHHAAFGLEDRLVVSASRDNTARLWQTGTGDAVFVLEGHGAPVLHAAFSPDGRFVVTASRDATARVWDVRNGTLTLQLTGHRRAVTHAVFNSTADRLLTASEDHTARIWNAADGSMLFELTGHQGGIHHAGFSPQSDLVVTTSADQTARLWDADTGAAVHILKGHTEAVMYAEFSPDGRQVATASQDSSVRIWDCATGRQTDILRGHTGFVEHLAFAPEDSKSKRLITASRDSTALLWQLEETAPAQNIGEERDPAKADYLESSEEMAHKWTHRVLRHEKAVTWAVFSPRGNRVATASEDGRIILWDTETAAKVAVMEHRSRPVRMVAFSSDGRMLLSASDDGSIRLWEIFPTKELLVEHAETILKGRQLTREEYRKIYQPD